jgi:hypothetical protein
MSLALACQGFGPLLATSTTHKRPGPLSAARLQLHLFGSLPPSPPIDSARQRLHTAPSPIVTALDNLRLLVLFFAADDIAMSFQPLKVHVVLPSLRSYADAVWNANTH